MYNNNMTQWFGNEQKKRFQGGGGGGGVGLNLKKRSNMEE